MEVELEHGLEQYVEPVERRGGTGQVGREVPGVVHDARQNAGLLEIPDAVGDDARRHQHQEITGDGEEDAEIDAYRALVEQHAQHDGDEQPGEHPQGGLHRGVLDA